MMNIPLTLEVEEGCKVDNLINEIDKKFKKYIDKAELYGLSKRNYLSFINYKKALKIDPENYRTSEIKEKINIIIEDIILQLFKCANNSFQNHEYELSLFYYNNTLAYMVEINKIDENIECKCIDRIRYISKLDNKYINPLKYGSIYYMKKL
jgi:hypothetical protein